MLHQMQRSVLNLNRDIGLDSLICLEGKGIFIYEKWGVDRLIMHGF